MIFESFTLLVMDIIIFKIKNYSVLVIYILDVYGLRLYCIWIAFMAWFAFCLKISNSWFYSVTFLKGYFKYSFIFHPLKKPIKVKYISSSPCHYEIYNYVVKLEKVNISIFKTREHFNNGSKFIVCKILFHTQLIYDSLNSSDILNTDRFIKMHGL